MDQLRQESFEKLISVRKERDDLVMKTRYLEKELGKLKAKRKSKDRSQSREIEGKTEGKVEGRLREQVEKLRIE